MLDRIGHPTSPWHGRVAPDLPHGARHPADETARRQQMQQHGGRQDGTGAARRSGTWTARAGVVAVLAAGLAAGALGGPAAAVETTPGAAPLPPALTPGRTTTPLYPMRTVPGYAGPTHVETRVRAWSGGTDQRFNVPTPAGSQLFWGDWNRDGAFTPAVYTSGHWVVYDSMIGDAPVVTREFDYGARGDRPVVGDFNKDGRTDVGVVRGNRWLLRSYPSAGATWRQFTFGKATDVPLTGDWDGD